MAGVLEIGEDVGLFGEDCVLAEFFGELLAEIEGGETIGFRRSRRGDAVDCTVTFMSPDDAAEDVELAVRFGDGVPAKSSAGDCAQIEILQGVAGEVSGAEGKELWIEVMVVAHAACREVRGGLVQ